MPPSSIRAVWLLLLLIPTSLGRLVERPGNLTVPIGADVTFRCVAEKNDDLYELYSQWRSNDGALLGYHDQGRLPGHQGRYSYLRPAPEALHLRIENVSLADDGLFECQMLRPGDGPLRASAKLTVSVQPTTVAFAQYMAGSKVEVNEASPLNVTCFANYAKPAPKIVWYIDGQTVENGVERWLVRSENKTVASHSSIVINSKRSDHGRVVTCEAQHDSTNTRLRANLTLDVLFGPDAPRISMVGGLGGVVKAGQNVTLTCAAAGGNPLPNVTWHRGGRRLDQTFYYDNSDKETRNTYTFAVAPSDHLAKLECHASNKEETAPLKAEVQLKVEYPPQGLEIIGESAVRQGRHTSLACKSAPSNPPARLTWTVNGQPVEASTTRQHQLLFGTASTSNLTITTAELPSDIQRIVVDCTATNDEGSVTKQHILRILVPPGRPRMYGLDEQAFHVEGERLNLTCEAAGGNPQAELVWLRGFEKMSGARTSVSGEVAMSRISLQVDRSLNGQPLKCEAHSAALDDALVDSATLRVLFPPRRLTIRTPDASSNRQQLVEGREAQLLCASPSSNPPAQLTFHFFPNGDSLPTVVSGENVLNESAREHHGFVVENVVTFVPTEAYDGTIVRCVASHPLWPEEKNVSFPLNVYYPPHLLVDSPISIVVSEGESFKENLTVKANPPVSGWRWRKNGQPFEHVIGGVFARGATLSGRNVRPEDAGNYTLYAMNSVGTTNVTLVLTVEYPARVRFITSPVVASVGEPVLLECDADGVPRRRGMVRWMRDGVEQPGLPRGDSRIELRLNATHANAGAYECVAYNGIGRENSSTAYLLVNKPPTILRMPAYMRAAGPLGGHARARCRAVAVPDASFVWHVEGDREPLRANTSKYTFFSGQKAHDTFESVLWINNIAPDDYSREIKCTAYNRLGQDAAMLTLGPPSPPDEPFDLQLTNVTETSIGIRWARGFDGGSEQSFEVLYWADGEDRPATINTTHTFLRIAGLSPGTTYFVQIRAHNSRGFMSEYTRPPASYTTISTGQGDGITAVHSHAEVLPSSMIALLVLCALVLVICNIIICVCYSRSKKRRRMREKTELARALGTTVATDTVAVNQNASVPSPGPIVDRPQGVQMYGTMTRADHINQKIAATGFRPDSNATNRSDLLLHEQPSENDEQSVRTIIEVSPHGYMQHHRVIPLHHGHRFVDGVDPTLIEYDDYYQGGYTSRDGLLRHHQLPGGTYATMMPYPDPYEGGALPGNNNVVGSPTESRRGSPQRRYVAYHDHLVAPASAAANPGYVTSTPSHHARGGMSTFVQSSGAATQVRPVMVDYAAHLNGDLV